MLDCYQNIRGENLSRHRLRRCARLRGRVARIECAVFTGVWVTDHGVATGVHVVTHAHRTETESGGGSSSSGKDNEGSVVTVALSSTSAIYGRSIG